MCGGCPKTSFHHCTIYKETLSRHATRPTLTDSGGQGHCSELDGNVGENPTDARDVNDGPDVVLSDADSGRRQLEDSESVIAGLHDHLGDSVRPRAQRGGAGN